MKELSLKLILILVTIVINIQTMTIAETVTDTENTETTTTVKEPMQEDIEPGTYFALVTGILAIILSLISISISSNKRRR